jgi:hypothetical protein
LDKKKNHNCRNGSFNTFVKSYKVGCLVELDTVNTTQIYGKLGLTNEQLQGFADDFISKIPLAHFSEAQETAKGLCF